MFRIYRLAIILGICLQFSLAWSNNAFDNLIQEENTETAITEQEEAAAETYIHQGLADQKYNEMCSDSKYKDICEQENYAFEGGSKKTLEAMMPVLTKAYSMFSMMGGNGFTATKMDDNGGTYYTDGKNETIVPENGKPPSGQEPAT